MAAFDALVSATVFISHAEEDQALAVAIAGGLERAGYSTWYYERDSVPGLSYLLQVHHALEACQFVVLVISPRALDSNQITAEVVRAHETGKSFVPVRVGLSHEEFQRRKPEWNMAVGAAGSIAVPEGGVSAILPEIVAGLGLLTGERVRRGVESTPAPLRPAVRRTDRLWAASGAIVLALVLLGFYVRGKAPAGDAAGAETAQGTTNTPAQVGAAAASSPGARTGRVPDDGAETPAVSKPTGPAAAVAPRRSTRDANPRCPESRPAFRDVYERGRLEARDDLAEHTYAFVICEVRETGTDTLEMWIVGSSTVGGRWSDDTAGQKAEDMERRGVDCEPTGQPAVRSTGANDPRTIAFVLCQGGGKPASIEIHATTRKADASAHPTKVLRVAWPG